MTDRNTVVEEVARAIESNCPFTDEALSPEEIGRVAAVACSEIAAFVMMRGREGGYHALDPDRLAAALTAPPSEKDTK